MVPIIPKSPTIPKDVPPDLRVYFLASDDQGGGDHRSVWPAQALRALGWNATAGLAFPEPGTVDVLIAHRPLWPHITDALRLHREAGAITVVDEDDDLEHLPEHMRELVPPDAHERHRLAIEEADAVFVATEPLRNIYGGPELKPTYVLRNFVDPSMQARRSFQPPTEVRVVLKGIAKTHSHDFAWLRPVVDEALGGALLIHIGDMEALRFLKYTGPRQHYEHANHADVYYSLIARGDFGIVPLDPSEPLNYSKSSCAAQDFAMAGKPVVVTRLPEQEAFVSHAVTGFLADTPKEFAEYTRCLLLDPHLRAMMGAAARERALEHAASEPLRWDAALREVVGGPGKGKAAVRAQGTRARVRTHG